MSQSGTVYRRAREATTLPTHTPKSAGHFTPSRQRAAPHRKRSYLLAILALLVCVTIFTLSFQHGDSPFNRESLRNIAVTENERKIGGMVPPNPARLAVATPAEGKENRMDTPEAGRNGDAPTAQAASLGIETAEPAELVKESHDPRTRHPKPHFTKWHDQRENGEFSPEEPDRLPGLRVHRRTFSPSELLEHFSNSTFIYTFVNGTELNHVYRKWYAKKCTDKLLTAEREFFNNAAALHAQDRKGIDRADYMLMLENRRQVSRVPPFLKGGNVTTNRQLLANMASHVSPDVRDRETDELRHSVRSMEKNIQWHNGRLVMVSPGHHPQWMDSARNFLASSCGGHAVAALQSRGTHIRATTVHQDAILPYAMRVTVNSHVIEQHLWRLKNVTPVHLFWNDDYFVNRNVAITDLFTEHGGTIVRVERKFIYRADRADVEDGWPAGVRHTNLFNVQELDVLHEDYLPAGLSAMWRERNRVEAVSAAGTEVVKEPPLDALLETAMAYAPEGLPAKLESRRLRRLATHAPFAYCTNMFRFLATRYEREFARNGLMHRLRRSQDLFMPFVYNAFIMARPWAASPQYLPYLLQLNASRADGAHAATSAPSVDIMMDNVDGCAPTELRGGSIASEAVFAKFTNVEDANEETMSIIAETNPLFFNINTAFSTDVAAEQLRSFLHAKFPEPVYLERGGSVVAGEQDGALEELYRALMRLPVVAVTSFAEGVCPLLRSLQLSLADHAGVVVPVVSHRGGRGGRKRRAVVEATLAELRADLRHRVRSAMPVAGCSYNTRVQWPAPATTVSDADAPSAVVAALVGELERKGNGQSVVLPPTCGLGGGGSGIKVLGIVVDGRAEDVAVHDARWLRHAVAMPGQTLALEDFEVVPVGAGADAVLLLSRASAAARGVEWIDGAAETDLLTTYPILHAAYEDLDAPLQML